MRLEERARTVIVAIVTAFIVIVVAVFMTPVLDVLFTGLVITAITVGAAWVIHMRIMVGARGL